MYLHTLNIGKNYCIVTMTKDKMCEGKYGKAAQVLFVCVICEGPAVSDSSGESLFLYKLQDGFPIEHMTTRGRAQLSFFLFS
jgi:hypothetical protein